MESRSAPEHGDGVTIDDAVARRRRPWERIPIGADEAQQKRPWEQVPIETAVSIEAHQHGQTHETPACTEAEVEATPQINETTRTAAVAALRGLIISDVA